MSRVIKCQTYTAVDEQERDRRLVSIGTNGRRYRSSSSPRGYLAHRYRSGESPLSSCPFRPLTRPQGYGTEAETRKAIEEAPTGSATPVKRFKGDPGADAAERQAAQRTVEGLQTDAAFFDQL